MKRTVFIVSVFAVLSLFVGTVTAKQDDEHAGGVPFQKIWEEVESVRDEVVLLKDNLGGLSGSVDSLFAVFETKDDHASDVDDLQAQIADLQNQINELQTTCDECCSQPVCGPEVCDGVDNDCNGKVDDALGGETCDTGLLGACSVGATACSEGGMACQAISQPTAEVCDGIDNDCDGEIDEGLGVVEACGACVDLNDPATYNGLVEYEPTYKKYNLLGDVLLCPGTYSFEEGSGIQARVEDGDSRILNCNGATLTSAGGQSTAVFATCNLNSTYTTGCEADVKVMNCNVEDFYSGITMKLINGSEVTDNHLVRTGGIQLLGVHDGLVKNNLVEDATYSGISLKNNLTHPFSFARRSESNTIIGNTVTDSQGYGLYLDNSLSNTVKDNRIIGSAWYGVYVMSSGYNTIYNNYLSNTNNAFDYPGSWVNYWNIEKTPGINIVGGDYLGGNYWNDYAGADTDGDGIGDTETPHQPTGHLGGTYVGGDELPLVE